MNKEIEQLLFDLLFYLDGGEVDDERADDLAARIESVIDVREFCPNCGKKYPGTSETCTECK